MKNFAVMQSFKTSYYLYEHIPNLFLLYIGFSFLIVTDFLKYISIIGILHDKAKIING